MPGSLDQPREAENTGLATHVLGSFQTLAQSVGLIGPSLGAASLVPLAFAQAGGGGWLTVLIASLIIVILASVISALVRRYVSPGALYTLIPKGIGPMGGLLGAGAVVLLALTSVVVDVLAVGPAFAQFLTSAFHVGHGSRAEVLVIAFAMLFLAGLVTFGGIGLSTRVLLLIELFSMTAIAVLLVIVLAKHGHIFDSAQLKLQGATVHGVLVGLTILIFAFSGFESAASLGVEAKRPRLTLPLALIGSVAVVGAFFTINAYVQILGFQGTGLQISDQAVPLGTLATHYGVGWLGDIVLLGVSVSWFSALCAWMNYAPRLLVAMTRERVLPSWFGRTSRTGVPYAAVLFWTSVWTAIIVYFAAADINLTEAFANIGTLAGYAAILLYLATAIAALGFAIRHRWTNAWFVAGAVISGAAMVLTYWYAFHPLPPHPGNLYARGFWIFVALLILACVVTWFWAPSWLRRMGTFEVVEDGTSDVHARVDDLAPIAVPESTR